MYKDETKKPPSRKSGSNALPTLLGNAQKDSFLPARGEETFLIHFMDKGLKTPAQIRKGRGGRHVFINREFLFPNPFFPVVFFGPGMEGNARSRHGIFQFVRNQTAMNLAKLVQVIMNNLRQAIGNAIG